MTTPRSRTLIINLFGGPGVGKSTYAAGLFYRLKTFDINCELVREYAKDRAWLGDHATLSNQAYVTCKQYFRQASVDGQVDVIITDSPIILGLVYKGRGCTPSFQNWLLEVFNEFDNLNVFLCRNTTSHPYNPKGRCQTEAEAENKDCEIFKLLELVNVPYHELKVSDDTLDRLGELVLERM